MEPMMVAVHELSALARTQESWVRIPLKTWMPLYAFILRVGRGLATGWSPLQGVVTSVLRKDYENEEEARAQQGTVERLMNEMKWMNMKMDSSWSASGNNDITDRIMAICKRDTFPKFHPDKFHESTSI
jgi:hypothetical protein